MKYDFNKTTQRRNTNSRKWDVKDNELPMWVADMDFFVYPKIKEAIIEAANRGGYGYSLPTEKLFLAYQAWWQRRHHILIDTKDMIYVSGVVSALDSIIKLLTKEKDAVMLLSPSYSGFYSVVNNNNRTLVASNLLCQNDDWLIDYDDVEKKIIDHDVKALIFCNPHNPTGKVWRKEELMKITTICEKHHVYYISDEIHCDIVEPGKEYIPSLSVYDKTIMCSSPSKVFNLAGLQTAITVIKNKELRDRVEAAFYHDDVGEPNYFVESAVVAAYQDGDEYVDELNEYVYQNKLFVKEYFKKYQTMRRPGTGNEIQD